MSSRDSPKGHLCLSAFGFARSLARGEMEGGMVWPPHGTPMTIKLPFLPEMQTAILAGKKICTSRTKKYGNLGDLFELQGVLFHLTGFARLRLDHVAFGLYRTEGVTSPQEFIALWNKIHPRKKYRPEQYVWVHFFERI